MGWHVASCSWRTRTIVILLHRRALTETSLMVLKSGRWGLIEWLAGMCLVRRLAAKRLWWPLTVGKGRRGVGLALRRRSTAVMLLEDLENRIRSSSGKKRAAIAYRMLLILYVRDHLWNFDSKAANVATEVTLVVNRMHDFT